jgi:hypothetical protein
MGIKWEQIVTDLRGTEAFRARVTGTNGALGWLVLIRSGTNCSMTFVPDEDGTWDGNPFYGTAK